jgi:putative membrane protein
MHKKTTVMKRKALILMILTLIGKLSFAQTTDTVTTNFVKNVAMGNKMEVDAGKLALKKGKSASVKAYGAKMISDHTLANAQLKTIALKKGYSTTTMAMPASPLLTGTTGATFDKNYVTMMVADHKKTIAIFENAAANAQDADIKAFATKTLPKLRQHLASIQSIATNMNLAVK